VARTLEQRWEEALRAQRAFQEDYDHLVQEQPRQLPADKRSPIVARARASPALGHSSETTAAQRKESVRLLVERVVVHVRANRGRTAVAIAWRGGLTTNHEVDRSIARYESWSASPTLLVALR
jgi:hypothetical protein